MALIGSIAAEQERRAGMRLLLSERDATVERLRVAIDAVRVAATEALVDSYRELAEARLEIIRLRSRIAQLEG